MPTTKTPTVARPRKSAFESLGPPRVHRGAKPRKPEVWKLRLYVAGQTSKSIRAFANLNALCETHLKGRYQIEVIDLLENPDMARGDQIVAIPTLVVKLPQQVRKIIGDLSNAELFVTHLLARNVRYEADLVDQLFNSSEKRLARILLLLSHFGKESNRNGRAGGQSGTPGTNGRHNPVADQSFHEQVQGSWLCRLQQ